MPAKVTRQSQAGVRRQGHNIRTIYSPHTKHSLDGPRRKKKTQLESLLRGNLIIARNAYWVWLASVLATTDNYTWWAAHEETRCHAGTSEKTSWCQASIEAPSGREAQTRSGNVRVLPLSSFLTRSIFFKS